MKKGTFRIVTAIMSVLLIMVCAPVTAYAVNSDDANESQIVASTVSGYAEYVSTFKSEPSYDGDAISISAEAFTENTHTSTSVLSEYEGEQGVVIFDGGKGSISYTVTVPKSAKYNIGLKYLVLSDKTLNPKLSLSIDGKNLFAGCDKIELKRYWVDSSKEPLTDEVGNEFSPEQLPYMEFVSLPLADSTGIEIEPYEFYLNEGIHTITLTNISVKTALSEIFLSAPENIKQYSEVYAQISAKGAENYIGEPIIIEGENADIKSTHSLKGKADNGSPVLSPSSPAVSLLNYIGGDTWASVGEELIWNFTAPEDGFYQIGFAFKQNIVINGDTYRWLKIDGKTPFAEAQNLKFSYDTGWQFSAFSDKNEQAYLFYLTAGEHTISLEATLAEMSPYYKALNDYILEIGNLYLDIIMITGESPDVNRDYDLFDQIPDFNERLKSLSDRLSALASEMENTSKTKNNQYVAAIKNMTRVINSMYENPYTAQVYVSDYYSQYTNLGSWLSEIASMPLSIDRIYIASPESGFGEKKVGFFEKMGFGIKRFLLSFLEDYQQVSAPSKDGQSITIWCNWGRDQAMVLNNLIQESFTPSTNISVNLELTNADLIKGILSNTQPDLSLHLSRTTPVNLAMRGAVCDLTEFEDYDEVIQRFGDTALTPYIYNGGVYALPDTQSFYIMFYRTDVFEQLGLKVPNTWPEFLDASATISRNNMTVYLPYVQITSTTTVNTGVGGLNLFSTVLQQFGHSVYNEEGNACTLEEPESLAAFKYWTDMYTKYKIPTTQSFYNRFKVGTCPLGIDAYTQYTQIKEAAPEIEGLWDIALVPGIMDEEGNINRSVSGSGTGCSILEKSDKKAEAWAFLKWWTSAKTQLSYNNGVESILGTIARTTTATIEAFEEMSWEDEDLKTLKEQREQIVEVPEVPGSYYLTRAVDQAYWSVVEGTSNEKDALIKWGKIANNEIARKIKQYSGN